MLKKYYEKAMKAYNAELTIIRVRYPGATHNPQTGEAKDAEGNVIDIIERPVKRKLTDLMSEELANTRFDDKSAKHKRGRDGEDNEEGGQDAKRIKKEPVDGDDDDDDFYVFDVLVHGVEEPVVAEPEIEDEAVEDHAIEHPVLDHPVVEHQAIEHPIVEHAAAPHHRLNNDQWQFLRNAFYNFLHNPAFQAAVLNELADAAAHPRLSNHQWQCLNNAFYNFLSNPAFQAAVLNELADAAANHRLNNYLYLFQFLNHAFYRFVNNPAFQAAVLDDLSLQAPAPGPAPIPVVQNNHQAGFQAIPAGNQPARAPASEVTVFAEAGTEVRVVTPAGVPVRITVTNRAVPEPENEVVEDYVDDEEPEVEEVE